MPYSKPITEIISQRFSCRSYLERPIEGEKRQQLAAFLSATPRGPFGSETRFELVAATEQDRQALRGLGTYGFIRGATGFVIGVEQNGKRGLEDLGYLMERIILFATDMGLGTCWLGGTFTKSRFARKASVTPGESVPAIASIGYIAEKRGVVDSVIRLGARAERRLPWERIFFDGEFDAPLSREDAGAYVVPLEMVRLGPSASNLQPWRIIKNDGAWHFYLQRTPGYRDNAITKLMDIADMQRIDMGIAMSHFELAADELDLKGSWKVQEPEIENPSGLTEYVVSWIG